jgi:hypothetical protein
MQNQTGPKAPPASDTQKKAPQSSPKPLVPELQRLVGGAGVRSPQSNW